MRRVLKIAFATAAMGLAASAAHGAVTANGQTLSPSTTISFGGPAGTTATSSLFLTLVSSNSGTGLYNFSYTFTNTAPALSNLTGFGFTTDPTLQGITGVTGGLSFVLNPINFPGGFDVDACAFSGNNCDAANNQGDLFSGTFSLQFAAGTTNVSLNDWVVRYASLTQLNNQSGEGTPVRGVPEPATWAMMLIGFGGIGMAMRRSRRSSSRLMQVA